MKTQNIFQAKFKTMISKSRLLLLAIPLFVLIFISSGIRAQNSPVSEQNKKVIKEYLKAISGKAKDEKTLMKYIDVSDTLLISHIKMAESSFPKYELIMDDMICENDLVAIRGKLKGKQLGAMGDIKPTGKEFNVSIMIFYRLKNNKIVEHWIVSDEYSMLKQLGVIN